VKYDRHIDAAEIRKFKLMLLTLRKLKLPLIHTFKIKTCMKRTQKLKTCAQRTKNKEHKSNTHQQVVPPYCLACKSSQRSLLPLILLDVFLLQSVEVQSPPLVVDEWGEGIRGPLFY
jgi:uncharacterized membrane protein